MKNLRVIPLPDLALYQPDIAQNVGTTMRSCACLGVPMHIIEPCGFPFNDRKFRRSGMDYMAQVQLHRHASWETFRELMNRRVVLLSSKARQSIYEFRFESGDILLAGRETAGVPDSVSQSCEEAVTIPMQQGARSLNVAVSCAISISEALRQINYQHQQELET